MAANAWIISAGAYTDIDLTRIGINAKPKRVVEYRLSDIGRYLISPGPIAVENRLLGCECQYKEGIRDKIRNTAAAFNPFRSKDGRSAKDDRRLYLAQHFVRIPTLQDRQLARHLDQLRAMLQPLDPVIEEIAAVDLNRLVDLRGVCEDEGGHRTYINLAGDLETKRRYVIDNFSALVPITLPQAEIASGLYEMRGLDLAAYQDGRQHRLLKFHVGGRFFACLLNFAGKVAFWVKEPQNLRHLLLLQQALETNPALKASLECCLQQKGRPLRLMLNHELDIDYTHNRVPTVYQELFNALSVDAARQKNIIRSLNSLQMGISFSYVAREEFGDPRPVTTISVMHDVKALESLRQDTPQLYAEINRKATLSEAGKYYLLESIKGQPDEDGL